MTHRIRRYLIAGLLVWLPLVTTVFIIRFLVELVDKSLNLLPKAYQPGALLGVNIPGAGIVFILLVVLLTGMLVTNILGRRLVSIWDGLLNRIPLVRTIHSAVKQVLSTIFSSGGQSFRNVYLIEYPRAGLWSIGFQTGVGSEEIKSHIEDDIITLFIPTTPNPTSGFLIMAKRSESLKLDMSVDDALKMVISLGVVAPATIQGKDK